MSNRQLECSTETRLREQLDDLAVEHGLALMARTHGLIVSPLIPYDVLAVAALRLVTACDGDVTADRLAAALARRAVTTDAVGAR